MVAYRSIQNLSSPLSLTNVNIEIHKTIILHAVSLQGSETHTEGRSEQDTVENIWTQETESNGRPEKTA